MSRVPPPPAAAPRGAIAMPPRRVVAVRQPKPITPKLVFYAVEGFGKTTFAAHSPDPIILMARGETGYDTLLSAGRVPQVPAALVETWEDALGWCRDLAADPQGRKTIILDAVGGFERLCHEFVCARDFESDWTEKGFNSYGRGPDVSVGEWLKLLTALELLNTKHGMTVVLLGHSKVKPYKNPLGNDYDRFICDAHEKTWGVTAKWADAVLFGKFYTVVKETKGRAKGVGGTDRVLYTERRDAFDAKSRYGMPPEIWLNDVPADGVWGAVWDAMTAKPEPAAE